MQGQIMCQVQHANDAQPPPISFSRKIKLLMPPYIFS